MAKLEQENNIKLEVLTNIFIVEKGTLKILLERKKEEPYKGYWMLPGEILKNTETIENTLEKVLQETIGTTEVYKEQNYTFSEINRNQNTRLLATSYITLIDIKTKELKTSNKEDKEIQWFTINQLPKLAFDHKQIIEKAQELLKTILSNSTVLKKLFPSDFTLPELQNIYESIMNIRLDRRNFRKKFINLGLIEDTGYKSEGRSGRPAKLYRFKENIKEKNLF